MKFLRWVIFIPVGFILMTILNILPQMIFLIKCESIITAIFLGGLLLSLFLVWIYAIILTPLFVCTKIAPKREVASILFGMLYSAYLFRVMIIDGHYGYNIIFMMFFWIGCYQAHTGAEG